MYIYLRRNESAPRFFGEPPAATSVPLTKVWMTFGEPFRSVCRIHVRTHNGGNSVGSGVLIRPHLVLTCAHVLYDRRDPNPARVTVLPNHDGPDEKRPPILADSWAISPGWSWRECRTGADDLAIIRLSRKADAEFWPIQTFNPSILTSQAITLAGYPAFSQTDKAYWMHRSEGRILGGFSINCCCDPWPKKCDPPLQNQRESMARSPIGAINDTTKLIAHNLDSRVSISGGPMWFLDKKQPILIALHAGDIDNGARKKAVLLNSNVRQLIADWIRKYPLLPPRK